jgi:Tfp pilus assembly protein PilZ
VATTVNIGLGGVFVASPRRFQRGDLFKLRFALPDQSLSLTVRAEVRWLHQDRGQIFGAGFRFVGLAVREAIAIQDFLRESDDDLTPSESAI